MSVKGEALKNILAFLQGLPEGEEQDGKGPEALGVGEDDEKGAEIEEGGKGLDDGLSMKAEDGAEEAQDDQEAGSDALKTGKLPKPAGTIKVAEVDLDSAEHSHGSDEKCGDGCPVRQAILKKLGRA